METRERQLSLLERMISATVGACLVSAVATPLDVARVRLQAQAQHLSHDSTSPKSPAACQTCTHVSVSTGLMDHVLPKNVVMRPCPTHTFNGTLDALVKIARYEGAASLYNGLPPTLLMAVPATVLYFATYDDLKFRLDNFFQLDSSNLKTPLIAGASARVFAATVVAPLELLRTRAQGSTNPEGMAASFRGIVARDGTFSLWRGLAPTLWRDVPFSAIYWVGVEAVRKTLRSSTNDGEDSFKLTFAVSATAGASAGVIATVLTHPFDVVKTRRQVFNLSPNAVDPYRSTWQALRSISAKEGFSACFTGLIPRATKVAPSTAIMLSSYELGKAWFAS